MHQYTKYIIVYTSIYYYLRFDEVTNHEREGEHQHLHSVTCHLGIFLAINVNVIEVGCVCSGHGDHGRVRHHCSQTISQPFPHCLQSGCGNQGLSFAAEKVGSPQNLGVAIQDSRYNVIAKQAQIPARNLCKQVYSMIYSYIHVCFILYWYIQVYTSIYEYIDIYH